MANKEDLEKSKKQKIVITSGGINFELERGNIMEIKQTHDGMMLHLKENIYIQIDDMHMPLTTKKQIIESFNQMIGVDIQLVIDFKNYHRPVKAIA